MFVVLLTFLTAQMYGYRVPLAMKVDPRCYQDRYVRAWVFFTDKGVAFEEYNNALGAAGKKIGKEAMTRRIARKGIVVDYGDIPVNDNYVSGVEQNGGLLIRRSKWLNAASFIILRENLDDVARLPYVYKIKPVPYYYSGTLERESAVLDTATYGVTKKQIRMFNIDSLHSQGVTGSGVKVGFLDTGIRRRASALANINLIGEYDFLGGDQIFFESTPVTEKYGVYSGMVTERSERTGRLYIFLEGDTLSSFTPCRDVLCAFSNDNGSTWPGPLMNISRNSGGGWVRDLEVCGRDTMYGFYCSQGGLYYFVMVDETLLVPPILLSGFALREPAAAQVNDTVYLFYHDRAKLYLRKGSNAGFLPEINIDSSSTNIKEPEAFGADTMIGLLYNNFPNDSLFLLYCKIPATIFTKKFIGVGKAAKATSHGDSLFVAYADATLGSLFRVVFVKSYNFGTTFTTPVYLSDELNAVGNIAIAKNNDVIFVAWESAGKIYFRNSDDNGNVFGGLDSIAGEFTYLPRFIAMPSSTAKLYCRRGDTNTDGYRQSDPDWIHPHHGTEMLSIVGGYLSGSYKGVAPGAQFLVAKTENRNENYELPVEEDTWVAGLEWMESKGADIVNSSLGYTGWYQWPLDYDGKTSGASIAATEASKRGIVVVNSSGNFTIQTPPQIVIPADAGDVITVGGIDTLFNHAKWESKNTTAYAGYWPTTNHAPKKPEIVSLCVAPAVVDPDSVNSYLYSFGTSGAAALVSGICALLLEGHRYWTVDSVRDALFSTASLSQSPNDSMGYGWPNAYRAFFYTPPVWDSTVGNKFLAPFPNPVIISQHQVIYLPFKLMEATSVEFRIYSISGKLMKKIERPEGTGQLAPGIYNSTDAASVNAAFSWDGTDEKGNPVASGLYYCILITRGYGNDVTKIAVIR